jgi:uncharacterized protein (DUF433 family)
VTEEELISRYIEPNPHKSTLAEAWLVGSAIPVWAIIGSVPGIGDDPSALAGAFGVSVDEIRAALAFYARHRSLIDARLAENEPVVAWPYSLVRG